MVCPFCLHKKTRVYNSRPGTKLNATWRRRECLNCKRQFTTYESADPSDILTIRVGRRLIPFARNTLLISLLRACDHRRDAAETASYLLSNIEQRLYREIAATDSRTITKQDIINITTEILHKFDTVAYVKYVGQYQPNINASILNRALRKKT